jgi:hypothetical protein
MKRFALSHKHKWITFSPKRMLSLPQYKIFSTYSALQKAMLAAIHSDVIRDAIPHTDKIGDVMT